MCAGSVALGIDTLAREGEALVVKTFSRTYGGFPTRGGMVPLKTVDYKLFASPQDLSCPKCIPFGSTVLFRDLPRDIRTKHNLGPEAKAQLVSPDVNFHASRDDIFVFENGATVRLSVLPEGTEIDLIPASIKLPAEQPTEEYQFVAVRR